MQERHSASFALIAYASAYLKCHHPAAFLAGLLNAWPMGFYNPATLVKDAQRHDVEVRGIDVIRSEWMCTLEGKASPAMRIGLRFAAGLREETAVKLVAERNRRTFRDLPDLADRVPFRRDNLEALAELGALSQLAGSGRRDALWQVAALERDRDSLFAGRAIARPAASRGTTPASAASPLPPMTEIEETLADYRLSGVTTGVHVMAHLRLSRIHN